MNTRRVILDSNGTPIRPNTVELIVHSKPASNPLSNLLSEAELKMLAHVLGEHDISQLNVVDLSKFLARIELHGSEAQKNELKDLLETVHADVKSIYDGITSTLPKGSFKGLSRVSDISDWKTFSPSIRNAGAPTRLSGKEAKAMAGNIRPEADVYNDIRGAIQNTSEDRLVYQLADGTAVLMDVKKNKQIAELQFGDEFIMPELLSSDGKRLLFSTFPDNKVYAWDLSNRRKKPKEICDGQYQGTAMAFLPGESTFVMGTDDGQLVTVDTMTGQKLGSTVSHGDRIYAVFMLDDGNSCLSISSNEARITDITTGQTLKAFSGDWGVPAGISFSDDQSKVLIHTVVSEPAVAVLDLVAGTDETMRGSGNGTSAIAISPDGNLAAVGYRDGFFRIFDTATGDLLEVELVEQYGRSRSTGVETISFDHTGSQLLARLDNGITGRFNIVYERDLG